MTKIWFQLLFMFRNYLISKYHFGKFLDAINISTTGLSYQLLTHSFLDAISISTTGLVMHISDTSENVNCKYHIHPRNILVKLQWRCHSVFLLSDVKCYRHHEWLG